MIFTETRLKGSYLIDLEPRNDLRGWFARTYCEKEFTNIGHHKHWVQINHSFTEKAGTVRGLHFQKSPFKEVKMVRCVNGAVYDIIVDLRNNSPNYLEWFGIELSNKNNKMLYIPEGFAHGFQSLVDNTEIIYHHSEFYTPEAEDGILYNDPMLNINWPMPLTHISNRDLSYPLINADFNSH